MALNMPVDIRALYDASKRLKEDRERPVRLAVLIEIDAPDELVEAVRAELHPKTVNGIVDVAVIESGEMLRVDSSVDAAIVLLGGGSSVAPTLKDLSSRAIPTAVVAIREDRGSLARLLGHPENDVLVGLQAGELIRGPLADWAMSRLEKLRTALGHNFEFVRRAVAKELVKKTAWQNAAVGVLMFIPGADMPIMTLNQGKMLLQIAATYGQSLDTDRVKELGAVVAGGFLFRTFARELVGLIPGFGWAVKGGIAYSGTVAMGAAAISYFEEGTDLSGVVKALTERAGEAASRVVSRVGERGGMLHADLEGARPSKDAVPAPRAAALPGSEEPQQTALVDVPECTPTLPVADEPETPLEVGKPRP